MTERAPDQEIPAVKPEPGSDTPPAQPEASFSEQYNKRQPQIARSRESRIADLEDHLSHTKRKHQALGTAPDKIFPILEDNVGPDGREDPHQREKREERFRKKSLAELRSKIWKNVDFSLLDAPGMEKAREIVRYCVPGGGSRGCARRLVTMNGTPLDEDKFYRPDAVLNAQAEKLLADGLPIPITREKRNNLEALGYGLSEDQEKEFSQTGRAKLTEDQEGILKDLTLTAREIAAYEKAFIGLLSQNSGLERRVLAGPPPSIRPPSIPQEKAVEEPSLAETAVDSANF